MQKAIQKYFPIFALPTFAAFIIGFIIPFVLGVYLSFCEFTTVTDATFVGLKNYLRILAKSEKSNKFQFFVVNCLRALILSGITGRRFRDPFVIQKSAIFDGF